MSVADWIYYFLPLAVAIALMLMTVKKTGAFEQKQHRKNVEALLERIAVAVEKKQ